MTPSYKEAEAYALKSSSSNPLPVRQNIATNDFTTKIIIHQLHWDVFGTSMPVEDPVRPVRELDRARLSSSEMTGSC